MHRSFRRYPLSPKREEGLGCSTLRLRQWLPVSLHILRTTGIAGSNPCAFTTLAARTAVTTCMRVGEGQVCTLGQKRDLFVGREKSNEEREREIWNIEGEEEQRVPPSTIRRPGVAFIHFTRVCYPRTSTIPMHPLGLAASGVPFGRCECAGKARENERGEGKKERKRKEKRELQRSTTGVPSEHCGFEMRIYTLRPSQTRARTMPPCHRAFSLLPFKS